MKVSRLNIAEKVLLLERNIVIFSRIRYPKNIYNYFFHSYDVKRVLIITQTYVFKSLLKRLLLRNSILVSKNGNFAVLKENDFNPYF